MDCGIQDEDAHSRWTEADISAVERWLAEERSYSSSQPSWETSTREGSATGSKAVTAFAQKKEWCCQRLRQSPPPAKSADYQQAKQAEELLLKHWAELGIICLKYLDESGFERTSPLGYSGRSFRAAEAYLSAAPTG